jgi:hypothetical protein
VWLANLSQKPKEKILAKKPPVCRNFKEIKIANNSKNIVP